MVMIGLYQIKKWLRHFLI